MNVVVRFPLHQTALLVLRECNQPALEHSTGSVRSKSISPFVVRVEGPQYGQRPFGLGGIVGPFNPFMGPLVFDWNFRP